MVLKREGIYGLRFGERKCQNGILLDSTYLYHGGGKSSGINNYIGYDEKLLFYQFYTEYLPLKRSSVIQMHMMRRRDLVKDILCKKPRHQN